MYEYVFDFDRLRCETDTCWTEQTKQQLSIAQMNGL